MARVAATSHPAEQSRAADLAGLADGLLALVDQAIFIADDAGYIVELNEAAAAIGGDTADALVGRRLAIAFPLRDRATGDAVFPLAVAAVPGCLAAYLPGQRGEFRLDWRRVVDAAGRALTAFILVDETSTRALERALRARETIDPITGLLNRQQFEARIDVALATCRDRPASLHTLCHLDIDHFRLINDALGPEAGDRLLSELAATVTEIARPGDAIARIGDNSFGLIFEALDVAQAHRLAGVIATTIQTRGFTWQHRSFDVSSSVGLVAISSRSRSAVELLRQAGLACLQAKQEGRGQIVIGDDWRRPPLHARQLAIGSSIKEAMSAGRISLAAQDIVPVREPSATAHYFELLLRMSDRDGELTPAGELIGAAERFDLIRSIDRWVLDEALDRLGEEIAAIPGLAISINLSGSSLGEPSFLAYLLGAIDRSPIEASALTFELTETEVLRHADAAHRTIDALRDAGCRIALDDFGVGLSNFDYLQRFPVDIVKIDGRFVREMLTRPRDAAIVDAIVALAQRLGAQTVVEHVESAEVMARVTQLGADFAQGHYLGRPRPLAAVLDELALGDLVQRICGCHGAALPLALP